MPSPPGVPGDPSATARLFVAVAVPPPAQAAVAAATAELRGEAGSGVRWTDPAAVHLTLRFLGDTPAPAIAGLRAALGGAAGTVAPFTLRLAGAGAFPSPARARVLWLGVEDEPALSALFRAVDDACAAAGLGREPRAFSPHLTIGRPRPAAPRLDAALARVGFVAAFSVDSFQLMASELTRAGARHTRLDAFTLGWARERAAPAAVDG